MFDPLDWLDIARGLRDRGDEAALRAAAGRAYYGVWLRSRLHLETSGRATFQGDRTDHRAVSRALRSGRRSAALALEQLARHREAADYDARRAYTAQDADAALHLAAEVQRLCTGDWDASPLSG